MKKSLLTILVLLSMLAAVMGTAAAPMVSDPVVSRNLAVNLVGAKPATLKVENRTGGILYVKLAGPKNYSFSTSKQGWASFTNIEPGVYAITVSSSACSGKLSFRKQVKGITALKKMILCK